MNIGELIAELASRVDELDKDDAARLEQAAQALEGRGYNSLAGQLRGLVRVITLESENGE